MMFDAKNLRVVMAGSGDPYRVLNDRRRKIIRALHENYKLSEIQARLQPETDDTLEQDLRMLLESSLIVEAGDTYRPDFLVVNRAETERVTSHARSSGDRMYKRLLENWKSLSTQFAQLTVSENTTLRDVGFLLVGAIILDVGLLECLAQDASLMPPAPHRPAPDLPDAHYYLWMIDGQPHDLGKYGQMSMPLPAAGWSFFTFGQYTIGQQANEARYALEKKVIESSEEHHTPEQLADLYDLLAVNKDDIARWLPVVRQQADDLRTFYTVHESAIRELHASLRAGTPRTSGEFFCWYDHLVYSHVIDRLEQSGMIDIPDTRFMGAVWQDESGLEIFVSQGDT